MERPITLKSIGYVRSQRRDARDDQWADEISRIELVDSFAPDCLNGIEQFSHAEIVYQFHLVDEEKIERRARHPRENPAWPHVGIFAQRGSSRPNRLGVSVAKIMGREGRVLTLAGLDAIDGTPVLDIKPVMAEFLPQGEIRQPQWSHELMKRYWQ